MLTSQIILPANASFEMQQLITQMNQRISEMQLAIAQLSGTDGQRPTMFNNIDMQGKAIINTGNSSSFRGASTDQTIRSKSLYKSKRQKYIMAKGIVAKNIKFSQATSGVQGIPLKQVEDLNDTTINTTWPVGSVFLSVVSTNPSSLLGIGSWTQIAEGQFLVGYKASDPDFGIVEGTGGSKTVTSSAPSAVIGTTGGGVNVGSDIHTHTVTNLPPYFTVYIWKRIA